MDLGKGYMTIATDNGVRALLYGKIGADKQEHLYVADGWVANYGKEAKAQLKRLVWSNEGPVLELVGRSKDDFTFFGLERVDFDGDGEDEILARGNRRLTIFDHTPKGWVSKSVGDLPPVLNCAIARVAGGWELLTPARPETKRESLR
jgi:hypothetical protein